MTSKETENFSMTPEDLDRCERKVPIFSIVGELSDEQFVQVDNDGCIKAKLLTPEQLRQVEEALMFDYHFEKIHNETTAGIYKSL